MPAAYQYLRVRLQFEQTRLLRWGEKVGLAEELLDEPSRIQALFKCTVKIQDKYDRLVPDKPLPVGIGQSGLEDRFLKKTLKFLHKLLQAPQRLEWALIKQDEFKGLTEKLIGYNDAIEGLLEAGAMDQLLHVQRQTYMSILQLNKKVDDLKEISLAMQVQTVSPSRGAIKGVNEARVLRERQRDNQDLADLASFKSQQSLIEEQLSLEEPIQASEIVLQSKDEITAHCEATFCNQQVWIEWKEYDSDNKNPRWETIIKQRVKNLVTLLKSLNKSPYSRSPDCLGYFLEPPHEPQRYGFIYQKPHTVSSATPPTSLLSQNFTQPRPSLIQRTVLAHTLALSLIYLHSVNWLHKGLRSNNIIFFLPTSTSIKPSYASHIITGFDYAQLDLVDELTKPVAEHSENVIYRHPETLSYIHSRSKKSHNIYSLGIILIEIAYWQRIHDIIHLPKEEKVARKMVRKMRELLLEREYVDMLEGLVGDSYTHIIRRYLEGVIGVDADEENPLVGAEIQRAFKGEVVSKLGGMKI